MANDPHPFAPVVMTVGLPLIAAGLAAPWLAILAVLGYIRW